MVIRRIFRIIYSPLEAFKEIIKNPKYTGPLLVMILFVAGNIGFVYVAVSKTYVEQTLPAISERDQWTENYTLWTSNADNITESYDYLDRLYYGNRSIEFSIKNKMRVWMQLNMTEPINFSDIEGYKNISFRIKFVSQNLMRPNNAIFYLYSSSDDSFYYNMTSYFASLSTDIWNNLTIPVGPENEDWLNETTSRDWSNITNLKFEFRWPENMNLTIRIDGLFFRGVYRSELENSTSYVLNYSLSAFMQFTIKWGVLSGIIYLISRAFGGKIVWRTLLISVGFALITLFIQTILNSAAFATVPRLYYPMELFGGSNAEVTLAYEKILEQTQLVSQVGSYVQMAIYVWTIALCSIALRLIAEFSWGKSLIISAVGFFITLFIENLILLY